MAERKGLVEWDDQGRVITEWDGQGRRIMNWDGYKNHLWPRNLTAMRFPVPIYPGAHCTKDRWKAYNEAFDVYEAKVAERWQELQKTPYYREKKVSKDYYPLPSKVKGNLPELGTLGTKNPRGTR